MAADREDLDPIAVVAEEPTAAPPSPARSPALTLLALIVVALLGLISWNGAQQAKLARQDLCISRAFLDMPAQRTEGWKRRVAEHCGVERVRVDITDP